MSDHLIDRPVILRKCHGCGKHILTAISGGITVAADPELLAIHAEIAARLSGRATWDVLVFARRPYLEYRDVFRMSPQRAYAVVADHACGAVPSYQLIPPKTTRKKKAAVKTAACKEEKCPF